MNFENAKSAMVVPNSPAVKRQKTASGYNSTANNSPVESGAYDSANDDGDAIFDGYIPDTPKAGGGGRYQTQPTQLLPQPTYGYETQPTQILPPKMASYETQPTQMLYPNGYETQPTQILDRPSYPPSSPMGTPHRDRTVQVPASSPLAPNQNSPMRNKAGMPSTNMPTNPLVAMPSGNPSLGFGMSPQQRHVLQQQQRNNVQNNSYGRNVAMSMAPAGTAYRPPHGIVQKQSPSKGFIDLTDDDGLKFQGGASSDSDDMSRASIKPSTFGPRGGQNPFGSSSVNGSAKFQDAIRRGQYQAPTPTMNGMRQTRPERAMPVQDITANSLTEGQVRENITRIRRVLPHISMLAAKNALIVSRGSLDDALVLLGGEDAPGEVIELSDDELQARPAQNEPQMMRGLAAPTVSIRDKYSSTQALPRKPSQHSSLTSTPQAKPKRKLVQGRRHPSSPVASSPLKPQHSPAASAHDSFDSDDSGVASASEEDPELEGRVLKYLNICKVEELIELTATTKDYAELMINARPFRTLDAARTVENAGKVLKSGKRGKRAPIGDRIVDTAMEMFQGYEAIDALCAKCEELGKAPAEEMTKWGFDVFGASKSGELEMTSLEDDAESMRDSGIGSPSSGTASPKNNDEDIRIIATKRKRGNVNFLKKPDLMAESCVLKDYQVVGLNWLDLMYRKGLSCILADEMGLGKTCQVIAFISHLVETGHSGPHLVVCPGSTLENWLRECQNFAPQLSVEPYHGGVNERGEMAQTILDNRDQINIVVTTYDMAVKKDDNKFLRRLKPDVCVYDEGHYLKNPNSQRYQGLVRIPAQFRLLLTGTPLQNNLQELAALLAFIMPDIFEERAEDLNYIFKAKATTRDADHAALLSAQRIARARTMLTPFVLRRKKDQVLKHLPSKTGRVEYCTLHPAQKLVYDGLVDQARERARLRLEGVKLSKEEKKDENNPLMQLRKAAIHPMLFRRHFTDEKVEKMATILRKKEPIEFPLSQKRELLIGEMHRASDFWLHGWCRNYPSVRSFDVPDLEWLNSGKVETLVKLVKGYKENGDRVLIFSQFSLVLDILQAVLNSSEINYTRIDGSTRIDDRQSLIDVFRDDETITAFLLTTKAGGTGINLMYANKVIIFDGSFNPQDDRQAENRAHRVGQTRDVEVVRLVTKGTIEEQIYALGQSKLVLDGRVAGAEDEAAAAMDDAGEKAVARMLLEGITPADDKDETKAKADVVSKGKETDLPKRKKSSLLDTLVKGDEGEQMLV